MGLSKDGRIGAAIGAALGMALVLIKPEQTLWRISLLISICACMVYVAKELDWVNQVDSELSIVRGLDLSRSLSPIRLSFAIVAAVAITSLFGFVTWQTKEVPSFVSMEFPTSSPSSEGFISVSPTPVKPKVILPSGINPPEPRAKTRPKPPPPPVINMEAPYGNLAARCEDLGNALVTYADGQLSVRPEMKTENLAAYNRWVQTTDGMFRARAERLVNDLHADLLGRYIKDPQLEELLKRSQEVYQFRNGGDRDLEHCLRDPQSPMCYLSVAEIREIGERFVYLSTQIKR